MIKLLISSSLSSVQQNKITVSDMKKTILAEPLFDFLHDTAEETADEVAKSPVKRASPAAKAPKGSKRETSTEAAAPKAEKKRRKPRISIRSSEPIVDHAEPKPDKSIRYSPGLKPTEWSGVGLSHNLELLEPSLHEADIPNADKEDSSLDPEELPPPVRLLPSRPAEDSISSPQPPKKARPQSN